MIAGKKLAAPEKGLRRRFELVVLQPDERPPHQRERVQHQSPVNNRPRFGAVRSLPPSREFVIGPANRKTQPAAARRPRHNRKIEVDDVPARDDVGVKIAQMFQKTPDQRRFGGEGLRALERPVMDDQHAAETRVVQGH